MKLLKAIVFVLFTFVVCYQCKADEYNGKNRLKETTLYVSPVAKGNASGSDVVNSADFLNKTFWKSVSEKLQMNPIRVVFVEGNYARAYKEKPLILENLGHNTNKLTLTGIPNKTIFEAEVLGGDIKKTVIIDIVNSKNIDMFHFSFTGDGQLGYALRIRSTEGKTTEKILVSNCDWLDMRGIIYGATGVHQKGTKYVVYKECVFKRIGIDSHSHHIYNAYNPSYIAVLDSHFEDCTGDYVRFRDSTDYCVVMRSKFIRNNDFPPYPYISMPNFNKVRAESFASNYAFVYNQFINNGDKAIQNGIAFHHYGFDQPGYKYLLSSEEGKLLASGTKNQRENILKENFGINAKKVRIHKNTHTGKIQNKMAIGSFARYGALSNGWEGFCEIYDLVNQGSDSFSWESFMLNR